MKSRDFASSIAVHLIIVAAGFLAIRKHQTPASLATESGGSSGQKLAWVSVGTPRLLHSRAAPLAKPKLPSAEIAPASGESPPEPSQGGAPAAGLGESSGGSGTESADATQLYLAQVRALAESHLTYPLSLKRRGISGQTLIHVTLLENGEAARIGIQESSGRAELDELALKAVRAAAPFPAIPTVIEKKQGKLEMSLPVIFKAD